jgi:hypothetical protein
MIKKTNHIEQDLQQREKDELIAIIQLMLQQRPELAWVVQTSLPGKEQRTQPGNSQAALYRHQIEKAVSSAVQYQRDRAYREALQNTLGTLQTMAETWNTTGGTEAALTIYEVLVTESIRHFSSVEAGYLIFTPILSSCIDGLDTCFADGEESQALRQRVLKALFAIYLRFGVRGPLASAIGMNDAVPSCWLSTRYMVRCSTWNRNALTSLGCIPQTSNE